MTSLSDWCIENNRKDLLDEWDYEKNGTLKPTDITFGSNKIVWWKCQCGHGWKACIKSRTVSNTGCPYCRNKKVLQGFNDLATTNPELCAEWNYEKNGTLKPTDVTFGSNKTVWWKCQYGHEWKALIYARAGRDKSGCPYCSGSGTSLPEQGIAYYLEKICKIEQRIKIESQEIDVYLPEFKIGIEYDGRFYHKSTHISKENKKDKILYNNGIKIIRIKEADLNSIENNIILFKTDNMHANYEWAIKQLCDLLSFLTSNNQFKSIDIDVQRDLINIRERFNLYNKDRSLSLVYPDLAKEWNYNKNRNLNPNMFPFGSHIKVWWKCSKGHEWQNEIRMRTLKGEGCPYCAGTRVSKGFNDLETVYPEIASEWHPIKNGILKPSDILPKSNKNVWWLGKCGHEWKTKVYNRTGDKSGCPYCSSRKILTGFNDLATKYPEIVDEWHPTKNGTLKPSNILSKSGKKVWWLGKCGHEWKATVGSRTAKNNGCPYCNKGRGIKKRIKNLDTGEIFNSISEAARQYGITSTAIYQHCKGITQTAGGYHWEYI